MKKILLSLLMLATTLACTTPQPEAITPGGTTPGTSPGGTKKPSVTITTIAGTDAQKGFADGKGTAAMFSYPAQMTMDKNENLYVIDQKYSYTGGSVIRKVDPAGNVTTFAKGLFSVTDICVDPRDGITLYAIESGDANGVANGIFRISSNGQVTRLSGGPDPEGGYSWGYRDGPLATAKFNFPRGIAMDKSGNLYVADALNYCLRKIDLNTNIVTTLAGKPLENTSVCKYADGKGSAAQFCMFEDLTLDEAGNIYIPDWGNRCVRKVTPDGIVSTYIKSGVGYNPDAPRSSAAVIQPYRIHFDANSRQLFIVDGTGNTLKVVTPDDYFYHLSRYIVKSDFADNSPAADATHGYFGVAVNKKGDVFYVDQYSHCIRKVTTTWQ
ncbi:NHL repeat-containing protein [Spirosoma areae]